MQAAKEDGVILPAIYIMCMFLFVTTVLQSANMFTVPCFFFFVSKTEPEDGKIMQLMTSCKRRTINVFV